MEVSGHFTAQPVYPKWLPIKYEAGWTEETLVFLLRTEPQFLNSYVLLTVHLSIILATDELHAQSLVL